MQVKRESPLILVADDVMPTTVMLERIFEREGYQVKSVYDGISAIQTAQSLIPDLILLDINMPGMNGFDVLRELREDPKTTSIPTIIITAMGEIADLIQGLHLGADDYLRKPFNSQELLARARSKMKARKLEESLYQRTKQLEALLRVSEELSQHLEVENLLEFILYLVTDMISCRVAGIFHLDDDSLIDSFRIQQKDGTAIEPDFDGQAFVDHMVEGQRAVLWPDAAPLLPNYESGIVIPLEYAGEVRSVLFVMHDSEAYDKNDLRLLQGIARSASLAIRNAELYEVQTNYAQHLEDMVQARTQELRSAQQMLVRSEKLASVGRLAASVAHEIKNPLFPIRINLEGVIEDIRHGNPVVESDIEFTLESVERIKSIVDRLLGFTGNWQVSEADVQEVDVNQIINDIIELNQKFFDQENVTVELNLNPLPPLMGYKYQLEHVIMNLTLNAKDAMPQGGQLKVSTDNTGNEIVVIVEDTGSGISPDLIENIFEPFVSTKEQGNGLGLFISYNIIQQHNGQIEVESKVDIGTRFTVRLPLQAAPIGRG